MKPYGVPRTKDLEFPDVSDIVRLGLKSSTGRFRGKGGDFRSYSSSNSKKAVRRHWKKVARKTKEEENED